MEIIRGRILPMEVAKHFLLTTKAKFTIWYKPTKIVIKTKNKTIATINRSTFEAEEKSIYNILNSFHNQ